MRKVVKKDKVFDRNLAAKLVLHEASKEVVSKNHRIPRTYPRSRIRLADLATKLYMNSPVEMRMKARTNWASYYLFAKMTHTMRQRNRIIKNINHINSLKGVKAWN